MDNLRILARDESKRPRNGRSLVFPCGALHSPAHVLSLRLSVTGVRFALACTGSLLTRESEEDGQTTSQGFLKPATSA